MAFETVKEVNWGEPGAIDAAFDAQFKAIQAAAQPASEQTPTAKQPDTVAVDVSDAVASVPPGAPDAPIETAAPVASEVAADLDDKGAELRSQIDELRSQNEELLKKVNVQELAETHKQRAAALKELESEYGVDHPAYRLLKANNEIIDRLEAQAQVAQVATADVARLTEHEQNLKESGAKFIAELDRNSDERYATAMQISKKLLATEPNLTSVEHYKRIEKRMLELHPQEKERIYGKPTTPAAAARRDGKVVPINGSDIPGGTTPGAGEPRRVSRDEAYAQAMKNPNASPEEMFDLLQSSYR